jgi:glutamate-1-semialdehyde 2,1-aminomutase
MPDETNRFYLDLANRYFPGGVLGSFIVPDPDVVVVGGYGSHVWDVDGKEYIDYVLGSGPMLAGHAHPEVVEAVQQQAAHGTSFYALNKAAILLAGKIVDAAPCAAMIKFSSSGAEATFYALRLARAYTGRSKILKFEGAYHGHHDYAMMSVTPGQPAAFPTPVPDSAGIPRSLLGEVLVAPYNDLERTVAIIDAHAGDLAAVLVEPQQRLIDPQPGFLEGLRDATRRHGILLIFDEVVTGFRVAWGGAQELYGVVPDLATYGKVIGGGYPVSAVAGRADIMELANPRRAGSPDYVYFSGTLNGNAVGAAAGLATLRILERPGTYERLREAGDYMRSHIGQIAMRLGQPVQVVGAGPLFNVLFTDVRVVDYRTSLAADRALQRDLQQELLRRGIMANLAAKWYMSIAHSREDLDRTLQAFEDALRAVISRRPRAPRPSIGTAGPAPAAHVE